MKLSAACWKKIGVWGDRSCPQLEQAVHCRSCAVYSEAAVQMLDDEVDIDYTRFWAQHYRSRKETDRRKTESAFVFRLGAEWFGLPAAVLEEVCAMRPIHSLPHRRNQTVLGLVNVRGELLVCVSLASLLGAAPAEPEAPGLRRLINERLVVVNGEGGRLVFPVSEIYGIQHFQSDQLREPPATIAKSRAAYTRAIVDLDGKSLGLLDAGLLFYAANKSLA
jgi:chemotaxis-related protein WspD